MLVLSRCQRRANAVIKTMRHTYILTPAFVLLNNNMPVLFDCLTACTLWCMCFPGWLKIYNLLTTKQNWSWCNATPVYLFVFFHVRKEQEKRGWVVWSVDSKTNISKENSISNNSCPFFTALTDQVNSGEICNTFFFLRLFKLLNSLQSCRTNEEKEECF